MTYRLAPSSQLRRAVFPHARPESLLALSDGAPALAAAGILTSKTRAALFLAHVAHESGGLGRRLEENLNYSRPERLMQVWPSRFPTRDAALPFVNNPRALAGKVYDGRRELGNDAPGDGWTYRGRGWLQLTGKDAYRQVGALIDRDLVGDPDQVGRPEGALAAAIGVWTWKRMNAACDGPNPLVASTKRLNGGLTGLDDRRALYAAALGVILG